MNGPEGRFKVIVFRLDRQDYAVDVARVQSIERVPALTLLPGAPPFVKGLAHLRGEVVPVVDLRERLKLPAAVYGEETRMIVVRKSGQDVGLIVDAAQDVVDLDLRDVVPMPAASGLANAAYIRGIARNRDPLLVLIHLDRVLDDGDLAEIGDLVESGR